MNWYKKYIIAANVNQLSTLFQSEITSTPFKELSKEQQNDIINHINKRKNEIKEQVNSITDNPQYQSWIYEMLINKSIIFPEDIEKTQETIKSYAKISKSSNLPKEYKNIFYFKSFNELYSILSKYGKDYSSKNKIFNFGENEVIYNKNDISIAKLMDFNKSEFLLQGTNWCVKYINSFNRYKPPYYIVAQNNKKTALIHFPTKQFKDIDDNSYQIKNIDDNLQNSLLWLCDKCGYKYDINDNSELSALNPDKRIDYKTYEALNSAQDKKEMANILGKENINKLSYDYIYRLLDFAQDMKEMANILGQENINKLSDINVSNLLNNAPDKKEMCDIIIKYKGNKLSDINVSNLLNNAPDKKEMANILGQENINKLLDINVSSLLDDTPDKKEMCDIIIKYKGNNLSDKNVFSLLHHTQDKKEMANILGQENINKLSDINVHSLLHHAPDKKEMANILGQYSPKFKSLIQQKYPNLLPQETHQTPVTASKIWSSKFNDNYIGKL